MVDYERAPDFRAQFGEDRILAEHFQHRETGCCIEIGAYNGEDLSNSYYFEKIGWQCILIEAVPELAAICRQRRPKSTVINCAVVAPGTDSQVTFEIAEDLQSMSALSLDNDSKRRIKGYSGQLHIRKVTVPARTIDSILEQRNVLPIDFVTIDVEGHEWPALQGFSLAKWRPQIVIIERNYLFPQFKILRYFHQHCYQLYQTTGCNDWFRRVDAKHGRAISYRWWLLWNYYIFKLPILLPKILESWGKSILLKYGLFDKVKKIFKHLGN